MNGVPCAEYNGASFSYQPALRVVCIQHPRLGLVQFPVPPAKTLRECWPDVAEPLKAFWREVMGMAWNATPG